MEAILIVLLAVVSAVSCGPVHHRVVSQRDETTSHVLEKRFINPSLSLGGFSDTAFSRIRTRRSSEDCEKLRLCKLHARSQHNFLAAFQLYFVNKENARLWDHNSRSMADCHRLYSCYR